MSMLYSAVLFVSEGRIIMNEHKLGKAKKSINQLDANKGSSGVSNTQMSIMYNLSNITDDSDIIDVALEEKRNPNNK